MVCSLCKKYKKIESNFVKGCTSFRLTSIKKHEESVDHKKSVEAAKATSTSSSSISQVELDNYDDDD